MLIVAAFLSSYFSAIDTMITIAYWPETHPWVDLLSIPSTDDGYEVQIISTPLDSCKPDPVFGTCYDGQKAKYRYISVAAISPSKRFQYIDNQSTGLPPESPFGALFFGATTSTWIEQYKTQDREYKFTEFIKASDSATWEETGDTLYTKWAFTGSSGSFYLQTYMNRKAVSINSGSSPNDANPRRKHSVNTKIANMNPMIAEKYNILGRLRL